MAKNTITFSELSKMLGAFKSVENAPSRNGYGQAPNQFYLHFENGTIFQSYKSVIGAKIGRNIYLTDYHDYSNTTSGHCGRWCGYNTKERRKGLENGEFDYRTFTLITDWD